MTKAIHSQENRKNQIDDSTKSDCQFNKNFIPKTSRTTQNKKKEADRK